MHGSTEATLLPHLWSGKLVGAMLITFIVQGVTIGAYAARLAGVQTKRIATSISLFNLFVTTGRLANLFMAFFVGPLADRGWKCHSSRLQSWQHVFELQLRLIVLAGTAGMVVFALFLPIFTYLFRRGVHSFEARGSVPHSLMRLAAPSVIADVLRSQRLPSFAQIACLRLAVSAETLVDLQRRRHVRLCYWRSGFVLRIGSGFDRRPNGDWAVGGYQRDRYHRVYVVRGPDIVDDQRSGNSR